MKFKRAKLIKWDTVEWGRHDEEENQQSYIRIASSWAVERSYFHSIRIRRKMNALAR